VTLGSDWRGKVGEAWAREWQRTDRSFGELAPALNAAILNAAPSHPFKALDIGCGAGATSLALAEARADAEVIGVDLSPELLAVAEARRPLGASLVFEHGNATEVAKTHAPFDLFVSRHGVMFFDDPLAAFRSLRSAAAPGAALVFSCFRERALNLWQRVPQVALTGSEMPESDAPGPFAFARHVRVARILQDAGWTAMDAESMDYVHPIGVGADALGDALEYLQRIGPLAAALAAMDVPAREGALARIRAALEPYASEDVVALPAAAWIWTARAAEGQA
jgi:SAM-dependent methyltransferase